MTLEREFFARYAHGQLETSLVPTQRGSLASLSTRSRARITLRGGVLRIIFGPSYLWKGFNTDVLPFPDAIPAQGPGVVMGIESHALTPGATERVKARAKGLKVSLNDLVLAEMARLIALQNPPPIRGSRVLRLVVPVDMRIKHGRLSTCANKMSFVYLDVPLGRVTGSPAFARWISKRMKFLKRYMGMIVWRTIQFGPKQIAGLRAYLQRQAQLLTCYVSNLGVVSGFPTCVRSFEATPTLRRDTPLALMVYTFRGRLQLTVGFDTRRVTRRHARACMLQVAGQLQGKPPAGS